MLPAGRHTLLEQGGLEAFLLECVKRNVSVIPGALGVAEAKQNIACLSARIPAELLIDLKREKLLNPHVPTPTEA